jgi:hypothetical protein
MNYDDNGKPITTRLSQNKLNIIGKILQYLGVIFVFLAVFYYVIDVKAQLFFTNKELQSNIAYLRNFMATSIDPFLKEEFNITAGEFFRFGGIGLIIIGYLLSKIGGNFQRNS